MNISIRDDHLRETDEIARWNVKKERAAIMNQFDRITVDVEKMGGVPCIRGLRIPVATVLGLLAAGMTPEGILGDYPDLEMEDIYHVLSYAAYLARERDLPILTLEPSLL